MIEQIETVYDDVFVVESAKDDRYFIVDQHKNMIVVENVQHLSSFENGFARATTRDNQTLFLDTSGSIADKDLVRAVLRLQQKFSNPKKENLPKSLMSDESYKVYTDTDFFTDQVHRVDVEDVVTVKIEYEDFFDVSTLELKVIYRDVEYKTILPDTDAEIKDIFIINDFVVVQLDFEKNYIVIPQTALDTKSDDVDFIKDRLQVAPYEYKNIKKELKSKRDIIDTVLQVAPQMIEFAPLEIREDTEIFKRFLLQHGQTYKFVKKDIVLQYKQDIVQHVQSKTVSCASLPAYLFEDSSFLHQVVYWAFVNKEGKLCQDLESFEIDPSFKIDNKNILDVAIEHGVSKEEVSILLEKGFEFKQEYFQVVLEKDYSDLVAFFLEKVTRYDYSDKQGNNLLEYATLHDFHEDIIRFLLNKGVPCKRALFIALEQQNFSLFELLVDDGCELENPNEDQASLFDLSLEVQDARFAHLLVEQGVKTELKHCVIAMKRGEVQLAQKLLSLQNDFEFIDGDGYNLLEVAAKYDMPKEILAFITDKGVRSKRVLEMAIAKRSRELFDFALGEDIQLNTKALIDAFKIKNKYFIDSLLQKEIDLSYTDNGQNFLDVSIRYFVSIEYVEFFLKKGLRSDNALFMAVKSNNLEVFKLLESYGFDTEAVNKKGETLYKVSLESSFTIKRYIQNTKFIWVYFWLKVASFVFFISLLYVAIKWTAIFVIGYGIRSYEPDHVWVFIFSVFGAVLFQKKFNQYVVDHFQEYYDPDVFIEKLYIARKKVIAGAIVLMVIGYMLYGYLNRYATFTEAIKNDNYYKVKKILQSGKIDLQATDREGRNLLMYALDNYKYDIARLLLDYNISVQHKDDEGKTALFYTTSTGILDTMLSRGANINAQDNSGNTILHSYFSRLAGCRREYIEFMLEKNININLKNKYAETPLDIIKEKLSYNDDAEFLECVMPVIDKARRQHSTGYR